LLATMAIGPPASGCSTAAVHAETRRVNSRKAKAVPDFIVCWINYMTHLVSRVFPAYSCNWLRWTKGLAKASQLPTCSEKRSLAPANKGVSGGQYLIPP
jgi:hypothetical protein